MFAAWRFAIVMARIGRIFTERGWVPPEAEMDLRDGSLSIGFGFGKYVNRNVVDAYGGVSRGVAQWNVRASRALGRAPAHRL